jgi:hypothetical protein
MFCLIIPEIRGTECSDNVCSGVLDTLEVLGAGLQALNVSTVAIQISCNFINYNFPVIIFILV